MTGLQEKSTELPSTLIRQSSRQRAAPGERKVGEDCPWQGCQPSLWGHILGHLSLHRAQHRSHPAWHCRGGLQDTGRAQLPISLHSPQTLRLGLSLHINPHSQSPGVGALPMPGQLCHPAGRPGGAAVPAGTEHDTATHVWCPLLAPTATGSGKSCLDRDTLSSSAWISGLRGDGLNRTLEYIIL